MDETLGRAAWQGARPGGNLTELDAGQMDQSISSSAAVALRQNRPKLLSGGRGD